MALTQLETAEYLATMSAEMAKMADHVGLETLAYLYSMADIEAHNIIRSETPEKKAA